jgi:hypothetical protein
MRTHTGAAILPRRTPQLVVIVALVGVLSAASFQSAWAQVAPSLGQAQSFAALGGSTVINTGSSTIHGDLGVWPANTVSGFPPGLIVVPGALHATDGVAMQAQMDVINAYNALLDPTTNPCPLGHDLTGQDLGGTTLTAGVYCFSSSAQLTGTLTLNAQGDPNAVFIFQIGTALTTASTSNVRLINGAQSCKVFWQVGSSATLGTSTSFVGNILALTSITLTTGASVNGRVLARNGAVTLDTNNIFFSNCNAIACIDTTAPTVAVTGVNPGSNGHTQVLITVQDTGCGLGSIVASLLTNATISIPVFAPGTTTPVVVTATKITAGSGSVVGLKVTDVSGNVTMFDPADFTITANKTVTLTGILQDERRVMIMNDGLQALIISVNGHHARTVWLEPNTTRTINLRAMVPGDDNTISFEALGYGGKHGQAVILVYPK